MGGVGGFPDRPARTLALACGAEDLLCFCNKDHLKDLPPV